MKTYLKDLKFEEIIKRLKNGGIIRREGNQSVIKYDDGIIYIAFEDGSYEINPSFITDSLCEYYFETEEPFEIKEAGLYKTRDGRKAFVSKIYDDYALGIIDGDEELLDWNLDGFVLDRTRPAKEDIISKWKD